MFFVPKKIKYRLLKFCLLILFFTFLPLSSWAEETSLRQGFPAPKFSLNTLEGETFNLSDLKGKQKLILLYFYQENSADSLRGIEELAKYFEEHNIEEKYQLLVVCPLSEVKEEDIARIKDFWSKQKLAPLVLLDTQGEVSSLYKVEKLPAAFFLDSNLILKRIYAGFEAKQQGIMFQYLSYFLNAQEKKAPARKENDDGCNSGVCPPPEG
ncbi:MAG: hypothetical protein Kow00103_05410 [Candidatus Caldatribacteriota bacterium]